MAGTRSAPVTYSKGGMRADTRKLDQAQKATLSSINNLTALLDAQYGTTRGGILVRGETAWVFRAPNASGDVPTYNGTDTAFAQPTVTTIYSPTFARTGSDRSTTSSFADVTSCGFAVAASETWKFQFFITHLTGSGGIAEFALNGPTSPSSLVAYASAVSVHDTYSFFSGTSVTAYDTAVATVDGEDGLTTRTAACVVLINGLIVNGANAGTLILRHRHTNAITGVTHANTHVMAQRLS